MCQDASDDVLLRQKPYYWKHLNEGERVVGKPGRRQRVVSEGLSTTSLGRPSNVIVFRDLKEEPSKAVSTREHEKQSYNHEDDPPQKARLSAQDIEHAIAARHAAPRDEEVHASIDALRPDETIQSQRDFDRMQKVLSKSYTFQQLSRYLARSLQNATSAVKSKNVRRLEVSQWQPGQTPLQQRRKLVVNKSSASKKSVLVDQILRLVWHVTVHSEAQEVGEFEIKVQPWQLSMLFDLVDNGRPLYESLIGSRILLEACELHSWPEDNTLRITGRRQDTEEIARQLKLALLGGDRLILDLKVFVPLMMNDAHRNDLSKILSDENIRHISELTKTVLEVRENGVMHIYGLQESARGNARRLLVALLGLSGPCSHSQIFSVNDTATGCGDLVPKHLPLTATAASQSSGLHRRFDDFELGRLTIQQSVIELTRNTFQDRAAATSTGDATLRESEESAMQVQPTAKALSSHLDHLPEPSYIVPGTRHCPKSYWRDQIQVDDWEAEYCLVLSERHSDSQPTRQKKKKTTLQRKTTDDSNKAVLQRAVPGIEPLLSHFDTTHIPQVLHRRSNDNRGSRSTFDPRTPYLSAHFVPFTSHTPSATLPRLEMRFRVLPPTDQSRDRRLLLTKVKAVLDTQAVMVPLAHCSGDVRFSRSSSLLVDIGAARQDSAIRTFMHKLQDSVDAGEGSLSAPPELRFKLPRWLVNGDEGTGMTTNDVEVPYLFERFEQTQRMVFTAQESHDSSPILDQDILSGLGALSDNMFLDYREIEGGAMHGRSTSLSVRMGQPMFGGAADTTSTQSQESIPAAPGEPHVDTAKMTGSSAVPGTDSNARLGRTAGNVGAIHEPSQSMSDVERVDQITEGPQKTSSSLALASAALHFASLLTRASSGSLLHMSESK